MTESRKTYFGDKHIFTSRNNANQILLCAGSGETLKIEGASFSSSLVDIVSDASASITAGTDITFTGNNLTENFNTGTGTINRNAKIITDTGTTSITLTAPVTTVNGSTSVNLTSPDINVTGSTTVDITAPRINSTSTGLTLITAQNLTMQTTGTIPNGNIDILSRDIYMQGNDNFAIQSAAIDLIGPTNCTSTLSVGSVPVLTNALASSKVFVGSGAGTATAVNLSADVSLSNSGAVTLATVNSNIGTYGSSTTVPIITTNAKGLITSVTTAAVAGATLVKTATSTELGYVSLAYVEALQATPVANTTLQGGYIDMAYAPDTGDTILLVSCPWTGNVYKGGVGIFHRTSTVFTQDYFLNAIQTTFLQFSSFSDTAPTFCCIDAETASLVVYGDNYGTVTGSVTTPGHLYFFRRTTGTNTWVLEFSYIDYGYPNVTGKNAISVKTCGSYAIIGYLQNGVKINKNVAGDWGTVKQTLFSNSNVSATTPYAPLVAITTTGLYCAFQDIQRNMIRTFRRVTETWTETSSYGVLAGDSTILALDYKATTLAYCTSKNVYLKLKNSTATSLFLAELIIAPNYNAVLKACSLDVLGTTLVIIGDESTEVYIKKYGQFMFVFSTVLYHSGGYIPTSVANTANMFAGGVPDYDAYGKTLIHNITSYTPTFTQDINKISLDAPPRFVCGEPLTLTGGTFGSSFGKSGGVMVGGDISLSDISRINGFCNTEEAFVYNNTTQSIATSSSTTLTNLSAVYTNSNIYTIRTDSNSDIKMLKRGNYFIFGKVSFASYSSGYRTVSLMVNGSIVESETINAINGISTVVSITRMIKLNINDIVKLNVFQNSGFSLSISACQLKVLKCFEI